MLNFEFSERYIIKSLRGLEKKLRKRLKQKNYNHKNFYCWILTSFYYFINFVSIILIISAEFDTLIKINKINLKPSRDKYLSQIKESWKKEFWKIIKKNYIRKLEFFTYLN